MPLTVAIAIPREVLHAARMTPEEIKQELAVLLFQQGKISFGKAREMAGMTVWTFQQLLGSRGIIVHYDVADYAEDLATLKALDHLWSLSDMLPRSLPSFVLANWTSCINSMAQSLSLVSQCLVCWSILSLWDHAPK
jgi:predicted HTH domain antitoxin